MSGVDLLSPDRSDPPISGDSAQEVLIAVDSSSAEASLSALCAHEGLEVQSVAAPGSLLRHVNGHAPDLLLLGVEFGRVSGLELCSDLRATAAFRHVPVILIAEEDADPNQVAAGLLAGADDYCSLNEARRSELRARIRVQLRNKLYRDALGRLRVERNNLRSRATKDSLTGALGRSALEQAVRTEFEQRTPFAVLFVDIDYFKKVNDNYGHQVGDHVLQEVVKTLQRGHRAGDTCGRYGGEEFVMVLPKVTPEVALRVAERHRNAVKRLSFASEHGPPQVTISIGVAAFEPQAPDHSVHALLRRADTALYRAKATGRDRVMLAEPPNTTECVTIQTRRECVS